MFIYENDTYRLEIRPEPDAGKYNVYAIVNKKFGVTEAYVGQLAKAIALAQQFEVDLREGMSASATSAVSEFLQALQLASEELPPKGKLS